MDTWYCILNVVIKIKRKEKNNHRMEAWQLSVWFVKVVLQNTDRTMKREYKKREQKKSSRKQAKGDREHQATGTECYNIDTIQRKQITPEQKRGKKRHIVVTYFDNPIKKKGELNRKKSPNPNDVEQC